MKDDTERYDLSFKTERSIKIKIEVDVNPPLDFNTEQRLLLQPFDEEELKVNWLKVCCKTYLLREGGGKCLYDSLLETLGLSRVSNT